MPEPLITCPSCHTEIKLTESLAAPLVEATRSEFERRLREKDSDVARREQQLYQEREEITAAREQMETSIAERVEAERQSIAAEESKKARLLVSNELNAKSNEIGNLQEIIASKDQRLLDAQKAQAETMRKQRELDDALLAVDLSIEQRVQVSLGGGDEPVWSPDGRRLFYAHNQAIVVVRNRRSHGSVRARSSAAKSSS